MPENLGEVNTVLLSSTGGGLNVMGLIFSAWREPETHEGVPDSKI